MSTSRWVVKSDNLINVVLNDPCIYEYLGIDVTAVKTYHVYRVEGDSDREDTPRLPVCGMLELFKETRVNERLIINNGEGQ